MSQQFTSTGATVVYIDRCHSSLHRQASQQSTQTGVTAVYKTGVTAVYMDRSVTIVYLLPSRKSEMPYTNTLKTEEFYERF